MRLRGQRGARVVRTLGVEPTDATAIIAACASRAAEGLGMASGPIAISSTPSRAHPAARGRYLAGTVTLFPAAFADPLTLAWTVFHELGHGAGLDERGADAFAARYLTGEPPCSSSP